ncbi:MAG: hypothetical protein CDV28_13911 [Candidatus Electronema aureum]|uniref:Uncharacterized protein n=1 Tax=Candidatus Electronema aureum TaxID=2005002 RepID=A0A521FZC0_9BACT|nr:MAG: hypothetical protein CDV28_13911 [Candidatus Electronema aureum]
MDKERTRNVLQKLIESFPNPLEEKNFEVPNGKEQDFRNFLMELKQRGFIEATPSWGNMRENRGMILYILGIEITKEGRKFMEGQNEQSSQVFNIGVLNNASGTLNFAGRDINITNNADAEKIIQHLMEVIDKSDLPAEKKKSLTDSVKSMIADVTPNVLAGLFVEAVKAALPI